MPRGKCELPKEHIAVWGFRFRWNTTLWEEKVCRHFWFIANIYWMLCICIFSCVIYSFLTITLWGGYSYPHCIAEETEAQRSSETCPRSHNLLLSESQFEVILNPQPACTFNHHAISPVKSVIQQQAYTGCFQVGIHFYFKKIYIC